MFSLSIASFAIVLFRWSLLCTRTHTHAGAVSAAGAVGASLAVSVQTDAFVIDSTGARIQAFQTATNVSDNAAVTTNGMHAPIWDF